MSLKLKKAGNKKKTDLKGHKIENKQPAPKSEMDYKIEAAMQQIVGETLKEKEEWKTVYKSGEEKKSPKKGKKLPLKKKNIKYTAAGIGAAVILVGVLYGGGAFYYRNRFFRNTEINEIRCGNMTIQQAEELIKNTAEDYSLRISFRENKSEIIDGKDIRYTYISDGKVEDVLEKQNPFLWPIGFFNKEKHEIGGEMKFDENLLKEQLNSFEILKKVNMTAPQDACIAFEKNQFVIKEEIKGTTLDKEILSAKIHKAVEKGDRNLSAEKAGAYKLPAVTKDDEKLKHQQEVWNQCAAVTITYTIGEKKEALDGMLVKDWMTYDEAGNYVEDQDTLAENARAYAAELGQKYNTVGKPRTIISTATGQPVTIEGGSYGFMVDVQGESEQILTDIQAHADTTREPVYARTAKSYDENDIGNTYVEVDLTSQYLWYYKDGNLLMSSPFVSGTYTKKDRRTPGGCYYLYYKQKDQVLRPAPNPDGSYAYESPVKYWMPFNGGIGFHDANWRGKFGGNIYKYSGSHGCINLPVSFAGNLYQNIEAGCPIICFYR